MPGSVPSPPRDAPVLVRTLPLPSSSVTLPGGLCKQGFRGFKGDKGEPGQPGLDGLDAPCQLVQYSSSASSSSSTTLPPSHPRMPFNFSTAADTSEPSRVSLCDVPKPCHHIAHQTHVSR